MPRYAAYPSVFLREEPNAGKKVQQLLWGDFVSELGETRDGWVKVRGRGDEGWVADESLVSDRILEVNFVDIGQGDGCFIVTPDDRFLLIDAGEGDNMFRFLRWRFNLGANPERVIRFQAAVITHPDLDHYNGFKQLFGSRAFRFDTIYHNGIVERTGTNALGATVKEGKRSYLTELAVDRAALDAVIGDPVLRGRKTYPNLLRTAAESGRARDIRMLCADDGFLPGYGADRPLSIEVVGPVPEPDAAGRRRLRTLGDAGKTKNGHSVVLRLRVGDVRVLLGGDLNVPAENHLLQHHTGVDPATTDAAKRATLLQKARTVLEADFAKACHHGSSDFSSLFLQAVNALATVVSSGDDEQYCHPRPDALGAFGKHGRGERPLIFSTELARSTKERIKDPATLRATITELFALKAETTDDAARAKIQQRIDTAFESLDRSVAVYGMINLRTDGRRAIVAQKLEAPREATGEKWDLHRFEQAPDGSGLRYVPKG